MKNLPTGAAQSVTDTVERVRALFKDRAEWTPKPQAERKNFRRASRTARRFSITMLRSRMAPDPHIPWM